MLEGLSQGLKRLILLKELELSFQWYRAIEELNIDERIGQKVLLITG